MDNNEVWKSVKGFEGLYEVSNLGRVRSIEHIVNRNKRGSVVVVGRVLNQATKRGYKEVILTANKKPYYRKVHQLVAEVFVEVPDELKHLVGIRTERGYPMLVVNHKDRDKANNVPSNLEWCTQKYNATYDGAVLRRAMRIEKPIAQYDKDGVLVGTYKSVTEAARMVGATVGNISKCANGMYGFKTAKGYFWQYIE